MMAFAVVVAICFMLAVRARSITAMNNTQYAGRTGAFFPVFGVQQWKQKYPYTTNGIVAQRR